MSQLDHAMQRIGRIIAADQQLTVDVRGVKPYATPGRVVIPAIDTYAWLGRDAERMLHGLLDHETAHALDTVFEMMQDAAKRGPAFKCLLNALEDGYIEARQGRRYLGCRQNLEMKNRWYWERSGGDYISAQDRIRHAPDVWSAFCLAATMVVRVHGGTSVDSVKELNPQVHAMLRRVEDDLDAVVALASKPKASREVFAIAERIYKLFAQEAQNTDAQDDHAGDPEKGDGNEEEGGGEGESDGEDAQDRDSSDGGGNGGEDDAPSDSEGDSSEDDRGDGDERDSTPEQGGGDEEGDPKAGTTDSDGGRSARSHGSEREGEGNPKAEKREEPVKMEFEMKLERWTEPVDFSFNPEDEITRRISKVFEQPSRVQPYTVFSNEFDFERDFAADDNRSFSTRWDKAVDEARMAADALVLAFESALRAKRERRPIGGHDEGEVDTTLLAEYGVGACPADRLYTQYALEDDDDVCVGILLDCSGSMGSGAAAPSRLARQAAIAMHLALAQCQLSHEITGFTTLHSDNDDSDYRCPWTKGVESAVAANFAALRTALIEAEQHGTNVRFFAREVLGAGRLEDAQLCVPVHAIFKSYEREDARGLMHVTGIANNLDGEAVLWQARRLARRPERRRVLFVLSDGYPAGSRDNAQGARHLKEVVQRIMDAGIEVYGIGMRSEAVAQFYPIYWVANDMDDLATLAVESMIEVLTRSRMERAWVALGA